MLDFLKIYVYFLITALSLPCFISSAAAFVLTLYRDKKSFIFSSTILCTSSTYCFLSPISDGGMFIVAGGNCYCL